MDQAYWHLALNHIPIIGVPFALLLLAVGLWRRSDELKALGFFLFVLLAGVTAAVYLLGEGGEDFVEKIAGISEAAMEDHEESAVPALWTVVAAGVVSLFGLIRYGGFTTLIRRVAEGEPARASRIPAWLTILVLVIGIAGAGFLAYTSRIGGKIRHTEFDSAAGAVQTAEPGSRGRNGREGRDDDDH